MVSLGILTYTFCSSNTLPNTSPGSMHTRSVFLAVAVFIFHVTKHVLSWPNLVPTQHALLKRWGLGTRLFLAGGVHARNNIILKKWHIALSIDLECLRITEE